MGIVEYYIIGISILGFILYLINMWLYNHTADGQIDNLLTIISLLGGAIGIFIAIVLFDRKSVKDNMMSRVFLVCILVIQIIIILFIKGYHAENITIAFWEFFDNNRFWLLYAAAINFVTFAVYAFDKVAAVEHRSRIRIVSLLALAFIGGSIGAILAMYLLRHKTKKDYFTVGIPLIMVMQGVVIFYLMNSGL